MRLRTETQGHASMQGMGSTVVLALVRDKRAIIAHLGDSRAYLLHAGRLRQLTRDHTLAESLVAAGAVSADEAAGHPARSRLTRYVGMPGDPSSETQIIELATAIGSCSVATGYTIWCRLRTWSGFCPARGVADVCRELIAAANEAGGEDNVTAVVIEVGR